MMPKTLVQTSYGMVQGVQEGIISSWKGIPYAQPPLGERRFRPPQPPEDCLTLNIWSPGADSKLRPVLVWFHGGGWLLGSGRLHDATSLATLGDVVVVTLNYRLGPFGFLHLAAFGGDPHRVTVFGESAGAMSIGTLLALPAAQGLFQQAVLQSGTVGPIRSSAEATALAHTFLKILNVSPEALSSLEQVSAERLVEAASALPDWQGTTGAGDKIHFAPVIDGVILPQPPLQAIASGMAKHIPIIVGTTRDECFFYLFADPSWREADDETLIRRVKQQVGTT